MLPTLQVLIINYCWTYPITKLITIFFLILLNTGIMVNIFVMADEMGLGKTVQVVCFLNHIIKERLTAFPALVLAPKSILLQWEKVCRSLCNLVMLSLVFCQERCRNLFALQYGKFFVSWNTIASILVDNYYWRAKYIHLMCYIYTVFTVWRMYFLKEIYDWPWIGIWALGRWSECYCLSRRQGLQKVHSSLWNVLFWREGFIWCYSDKLWICPNW